MKRTRVIRRIVGVTAVLGMLVATSHTAGARSDGTDGSRRAEFTASLPVAVGGDFGCDPTDPTRSAGTFRNVRTLSGDFSGTTYQVGSAVRAPDGTCLGKHWSSSPAPLQAVVRGHCSSRRPGCSIRQLATFGAPGRSPRATAPATSPNSPAHSPPTPASAKRRPARSAAPERTRAEYRTGQLRHRRSSARGRGLDRPTSAPSCRGPAASTGSNGSTARPRSPRQTRSRHAAATHRLKPANGRASHPCVRRSVPTMTAAGSNAWAPRKQGRPSPRPHVQALGMAIGVAAHSVVASDMDRTQLVTDVLVVPPPIPIRGPGPPTNRSTGRRANDPVSKAGTLRVSDDDRNRVVEALKQHTADRRPPRFRAATRLAERSATRRATSDSPVLIPRSAVERLVGTRPSTRTVASMSATRPRVVTVIRSSGQ